MKQFNVIIWDPNNKKFIPYNIIPYFVDTYKTRVANHKTHPRCHWFKVPVTIEDFRLFVESEAQYQFWGRCEYEIILKDWPCGQKEEKIDIYEQILMNLNIITEIVMKECG